MDIFLIISPSFYCICFLSFSSSFFLSINTVSFVGSNLTNFWTFSSLGKVLISFIVLFICYGFYEEILNCFGIYYPLINYSYFWPYCFFNKSITPSDLISFEILIIFDGFSESFKIWFSVKICYFFNSISLIYQW